MAKQINFVINGKGGVGKSFFRHELRPVPQGLRHRPSRHRQRPRELRAQAVPLGFGLHQSRTAPPDRPDVHRAETADLLVIDCRAASTDLFIDFFEEVGLAEVFRTIGARLTVVCPVNHEAASVEQLRILSDALGNGCRWVVVKNEAHSDAFKLYENRRTRRHYSTPCMPAIAMPRLHDWLVALLNEHNVPITAALQHSGFKLLDRQRPKHWQSGFYKELEAASDLLLTPATTAAI